MNYEFCVCILMSVDILKYFPLVFIIIRPLLNYVQHVMYVTVFCDITYCPAICRSQLQTDMTNCWVARSLSFSYL